VGSVGILSLSFDDPVSINRWNMGLSLFSNFFLLVAEDADCAMMDEDTNCPSLAFICSIGRDKSTKLVDVGCRLCCWRLKMWISFDLFVVAAETAGDVPTGSILLWWHAQRKFKIYLAEVIASGVASSFVALNSSTAVSVAKNASAGDGVSREINAFVKNGGIETALLKCLTSGFASLALWRSSSLWMILIVSHVGISTSFILRIDSGLNL